MPTITKLYTLKEAEEHNNRDDCWVIVDGMVYDVTSYLDEHPGGDDVLLEATGRDATEDFKDAGHSKDAIELMKSYCIGELEFDPSSPFIPELEILKKPESKDLIHKFMDAALQYWTIPVAIVGVSVVAGMFYLRRK